MKLHLQEDELSQCVSCGLCLPHCPTFRVTGEEALSPRGRIAAMRAVQVDNQPISTQFVNFMETCVQCRGCEPACPSGVPFGRLMEGTRSALADMGTITPWWQRWAFAMLPRHRVLLVGSTMLAVGQRLRLIPARLGLGRIPVRRGPKLRSTGPDVWLLTGCVMDAWQRPTHRNTGSVLSNVGVTYTVPKGGSGCCGALHVHAGLRSQAIALARNVIRSMPGSNPIVVNSAGCGAMLKDYGHLIGTEEAIAFSDRVVDIHEFLEPLVDKLTPSHQIGRVIVQDPCHLRHVQQRHQSVRSVLAAVGEVVELDHDGLCCGAGGAYSALQPELAQQIRQRTVEAIARAGGGVVASANPGCAMHLTAAGIVVKHPMDLLAEALR